tara:strand:- start:2782 stop:2952 length:171 start_codon:yes stop_codon:yes gene_type:complete
MKTNDDEKTSQLSINNLQKGIYKYKVVDDFQNEYIGSFLIKYLTQLFFFNFILKVK